MTGTAPGNWGRWGSEDELGAFNVLTAGHVLEAIRLAREADECLDFVVSADPLEDDRVNVLERWTDRAALMAFRGEGPGDDLRSLIKSADVNEYEAHPCPRTETGTNRQA